VGRSAAVKSAPTAEARISARREASRLSAMVVAAEGAGVYAALAVGLRVPSSSLAVSVEWPAACTVSVEASATIAATVPVEASAAIASTAIEGVPVIKCSAV
jgi:hypothetical protein